MTSTFNGSLPRSQTNPSPPLTWYRPDLPDPAGTGLIVFPGGGYGGLASHEGEGYARFFAKHGIACFAVTYRLASQGFRHPAMIEDAMAAIHTIRRNAAAYGVNPVHIGVIGSSAGGHLAAHLLTTGHRRQGEVSCRPDFGVLCYPVITTEGRFAHIGSRNNLLGPDPDRTLLEAVSPERHVTALTPPCFIWHTVEDSGVPVENSLIFAQALRENKVPFEMHLYQTGEHGLGLNTDHNWGNDCVKWIEALVRTGGLTGSSGIAAG